MSSDQDRNLSAGEGNTSSAGKEPFHDETKTSATGNVPSSGHSSGGLEKLVETGGSGGAPMQANQGYEAMAHH